MILHVTERQDFKTCRRLWKYKYKEHLKKVKESQGALWMGRLIHYALAAYYERIKLELGGNRLPKQDYLNIMYNAVDYWIEQKVSTDARGKMLAGEIEVLESTIHLVKGMLQGYLDKYSQGESWKVVSVEEPIQVIIPGTKHKLVGTLDMVVRWKSRLWVVDHKGYKSFVEPGVLELDDQMSAYCYLVWRKYGEYPAGAIYNQLRKALPCEPYLLKDGKRLSKDKSIDTTPEKYLEAINKYNLDINDYTDILAKLEDNKFFVREIIARNKYELSTWEENLIMEARDMSQATKKGILYPAPTKDCDWNCSDYKILCKCENEKGNVQLLKNMCYVVDEERSL